MLTHLAGALLLFSTAAWSASGLTYSTYLRAGLTPAAIATDTSGNVYLAGSTLANPNYPATWPSAAIVVKLDPAGASYRYTRTIGGSAHDTAAGIAVDAAGNAYVIGTTSSPDFPVTPGQQTGTLPATSAETRAFLVKLDPQGEVVFSEVLGSVDTTGLAVAVTAQGAILVSGSSTPELTATPGAYSAPNVATVPPNTYWLFLTELDATGSKIVFTATGIGGSALALDSAGNIYMAGSTFYTGYPTTPGAYQTVLYGHYCAGAGVPFCNPGPPTNQYLTKVDPAATKLIYSTGVGSQFPSANNGLAVDSAGNAYVTGWAYGDYNWTVTPANYVDQAIPFLTKLDPAGANALYSIPIGGGGVALGSQNDVYVGGSYNDFSLVAIQSTIPAPPPLPLGVTGLPAECGTNSITTFSEGTVSHVDATSGNVLSTVLVDGSNVSVAGVAFAGASGVWLAGATSIADTPITPGALTPFSLGPGPSAGAYLGEASFGLSDTPAPQIACIVDSANMARVSVAAPSQLITLLGTGLGPATGVAAPDYATTSLAGVTVSFANVAAPLLYVSSSQINVAVPSGVLEQPGVGLSYFTTMQVSVNGVPAPPRELPLAPSNPSLFGDLSGTVSSCTVGNITYYGGFMDLAMNADGTVNSCSNPAKPGESISLFVNGLGVDFFDNEGSPWQASQIPVAVTLGGWSAEVTGVSALNPFVWQVDVAVPAAIAQSSQRVFSVTMDFNLANGVVAAGPLTVQPVSPAYIVAGSPIALSVWVNP
jgi:uncharacterized protein (TIGR03437 family)